MKKLVVTLAVVITILSFIALPCLAADEKATAAEKPAAKAGKTEKGKAMKMAAVKAPIVKLERVEIASYFGYYLDGILDKEGKLTGKTRGAPLVLSFVYSIHNPNNFNILLNDFKFTVAFEGFDLNTLTFFDENYIPGKKTDHFRFNGTLDYNSAILSLSVTGGIKLKEMNTTPAEQLKKWWEGISDFNFPITVNGTANFVGPDGKTIIVPFEATFPEKK
jgi:hypothetical protein